MKKSLVSGIVCLAVGALAGYGVKSTIGASSADASEDDAGYVAKAHIADAGDREIVKSLRRRIAELEKLLAGAAVQLEKASTQQVARAERRFPGPGDFREHIERMKKDDPKRYAEMTNHFAKMRARQLNRTQSRLDFLASIDVGSLGTRATKVHKDLQKTIATREELMEKMGDESLTDEERQEIMNQLREVDHQSRGLAQEERENLLKLTASSLGLSDEDATALSETVQDVLEATESRGGHGGAGGPPPDGGQGGQGGAGGPPPAM